MSFRSLLAKLAFCCTFAGSLTILYTEEVQYWTPTPVPAAYVPVAKFTRLDTLPIRLSNKPTLLHFFNPDCPCSRFNLMHVEALYAQYKHRVDFLVVIEPKTKAALHWYRDYGAPMPYWVDTNGALAKKVGVYATPQAVILDADHRIVYRGNYNISRYCSNRKTAFAQMALANLLDNGGKPINESAACTPYGCTLPAYQ
jgi:hypothetical protein